MGGLAQGFASLVAGETRLSENQIEKLLCAICRTYPDSKSESIKNTIKRPHSNHSVPCSGLILIPVIGSRGCLIVGSLLLVLANLLTYWNTSLNSILCLF